MTKQHITYICVNCGDKFTSPKKLKGNESFYCPYCYSVKCGEMDKNWLPSLTEEELKRTRLRMIAENVRDEEETPTIDGMVIRGIKPSFSKFRGEPKLGRYYKRKIRCIDILGGKCKHCGYDRHPTVLQFHHKNPKEKKYSLAIIMNTMSDDDWETDGMNEVKKCELLCSNCHGILHHGEGWGKEPWKQ